MSKATGRVRVVRLRRFPVWLVHMLRTHGMNGLSCRLASSGWPDDGVEDEPPMDVVPTEMSVVGLVGDPAAAVSTFKVWCVNRVAALIAAMSRRVVCVGDDGEHVVLLIETFVDERGDAAAERRVDVDDDDLLATETMVCETCSKEDVESSELVPTVVVDGERTAAASASPSLPRSTRARAADVGVNTERAEFDSGLGLGQRVAQDVEVRERRGSSASRVRFDPSSRTSPNDAAADQRVGPSENEHVPCTLLVDVNGATMCSLQGVLTLDCMRALATQRVMWPATNGASQIPLMMLRENGGGTSILVDTMYTVEEQLDAAAHGTRRYLVSMYKNRRASSIAPKMMHDGPLRRERQRAHARR